MSEFMLRPNQKQSQSIPDFYAWSMYTYLGHAGLALMSCKSCFVLQVTLRQL